MNPNLLYVHPLIQIAATLLGVYAMFLGLARFQSLHMGKRTAFKRMRHVWLGILAILGWLGGMCGGFVMARLYWRAVFVTGGHAYLSMVMLPLMLFGLISGWYLHKHPARAARVLPPAARPQQPPALGAGLLAMV